MKKGKSDKVVDEYFSKSTIDEPPREPIKAKKGQMSIVEKEEHEERVESFLATNIPEFFDFKLTLSLSACEGNTNPHTIPVAAGEAIPHERVEEIIVSQVKSESFTRKLRAIVGTPWREIK